MPKLQIMFQSHEFKIIWWASDYENNSETLIDV